MEQILKEVAVKITGNDCDGLLDAAGEIAIIAVKNYNSKLLNKALNITVAICAFVKELESPEDK